MVARSKRKMDATFPEHALRLTAPAQAMDVDREFLDRGVPETPTPGRHGAHLRVIDLRRDGIERPVVEPDLVGEIRSPIFRHTLGVLAVAAGAIVREEL